MGNYLSRNVGIDLVRATEAAALSAARWIGLGKPEEADRAASQAMYDTLCTLDIDGSIVIGEEKSGHHPFLDSGRKIGGGVGPKVDVVVDAIDGRMQLAQGYPEALSGMAVAPPGAMWAPAPAVYMDKIVVNADVAPDLVPECMGAPAAWTLALVARAKSKKVSDLTVFVLDRPRHVDLIREIRASGARVLLRTDGDISGALLACTPQSSVDILMGVGGITEGLLVACAVKAMKSGMLGRLEPQSEVEMTAIKEAGLDLQSVLTVDELVTSGDVCFAATGITDGPLLSGVLFDGNYAKTNSLILRGVTRTKRRIFSEHMLE